VAFALSPAATAEPWCFRTAHRGGGAGDTIQLAPKALPRALGDGNGVRVERRLLASLGAPSLASGWLLVLGDPAHPAGLLVLGFRQPTALDEPAVRRLRHLLDQTAVAVKNVQLIEELHDLQRGALRALAGTIDAKSPWTAGHSERVTATAVALGRWMQLPEADLERLSRGGLLHDIGKIGIPIAVLDKPERLTEEERRIIETHPVVGAHILEPVKPFHDVIDIVRNHHERWDGKGYPDGLAGEEIPFLARIVAVADVYDAISSARPYRGATPPPVVLSIIERGSGTLFDPRIAEAFLAMMTQSGDAAPARHPQVLAEAAR
jgi:putative nucleotidyltransferase with HDIG domain